MAQPAQPPLQRKSVRVRRRLVNPTSVGFNLQTLSCPCSCQNDYRLHMFIVQATLDSHAARWPLVLTRRRRKQAETNALPALYKS
jgi:hypothetical protein